VFVPRPETEQLTGWALERIAGLDGPLVVDLGSGSGMDSFIAALKVQPAGRVIGIDMTDAMLAKARANAALVGATNLELRQAAAEALPVPDASFDLVLASLSLTLWLDQAAGAAELARVVSDNGKVVVVETKAPQLSGRKRVHGVKDMRRLLESAGLEVERVETLHRSPVGVSLAHAFIASP